MAKIEYSTQIKAMPGEFVSGDITWVKEFNNQLLLCLIDVAGHGKLAHELAEECIRILETHYQNKLLDILIVFNEFLKEKTRGIVLGLALIDTRTGLINYIGIGNVRARILGKQSYRFVSRPGVLGFTKLRPVLETYMLNHNDLLIMYSDGVSDRFEKNFFNDIETATPIQLTDHIMSTLSKKTDDSSCIVVRYRYD